MNHRPKHKSKKTIKFLQGNIKEYLQNLQVSKVFFFLRQATERNNHKRRKLDHQNLKLLYITRLHYKNE